MEANRLKVYVSRSGEALSEDLEQACLALIPTEIRAGILRFKRWQDRQVAIFGKLLLSRALRMDGHPNGVQQFHSLSTTRHGKPFIPGGPEFNISHSEGMVVLAIAQSGAVGIDIEKIRPVEMEDYAKYLPELANLPGTYDANQALRFFFDCWTQKEAVLKAHGTGLLSPLEQVVLEGATGHFDETVWHLQKVPVAAGYCCHVATGRGPAHVVVEQVDLMNGPAGVFSASAGGAARQSR